LGHPVCMYVCICTSAAAPGPITVTVCVSSYAADCCAVFTDTIEVKFCQTGPGSNDFFVYRLKNVPVCDMAYCAVGSFDASNRTHFDCLLYHIISTYRNAESKNFKVTFKKKYQSRGVLRTKRALEQFQLQATPEQCGRPHLPRLVQRRTFTNGGALHDNLQEKESVFLPRPR